MSRCLILLLPLSLLLACGAESPEAPAQAPETPAIADTGASEKSGERRVILFLGDSLSAGYGLDPDQAFPALVQEKIDRQGWGYEVVNAGLSGDTTAGGLRRIDWLLKRPVDVLFLELGGNDGLRGVSLQETEQNLDKIILKTRSSYPGAAIVVAGMLIPPNMGPDYFNGFREIFPEVARRHDAVLIPFLLEGVGGRPELNLPDGIHPTAQGHQVVADHIWNYLEPLLAERLDSD